MPSVFIGHGSPMNALQANRFTRAWRELGRSLPRPRAILAVSAHWYADETRVTAMSHPRVIHDFSGFPQELFAFRYPADGSPELACEVLDLARPAPVRLDRDSWGLDHGTWSVLAHVFPDADVPVVQLSIHAGAPLEYHLDLGRRLAPLRDSGVLILGSGNVVHNLRLVDFRAQDQGYDWAVRFDHEVRRIMQTRPWDIASVLSHPDARLAVPTPEHFLPLVYLCGLCAQAEQAATAFAEGATFGSLTMTSFLLGGISAPIATPPDARTSA